MSIAKVRRIKPINGYSSKTPDNLLLDAGAFFKNFEVGKDTYASAKASGKCLGVTIKGGEFSAKPSFRNMEFDGVKNRVKGGVFIDNWEVSIKASLAEATTDNFMLALGVADVDKESVAGYEKITGRNYLIDSDFAENITWVGCLLGEDEPCIIQIFNGLNESGMTMAFADKDNAKNEVQFFGYNDDSVYDDLEKEVLPPFAIYRPVTTSTETTDETTEQEA